MATPPSAVPNATTRSASSSSRVVLAIVILVALIVLAIAWRAIPLAQWTDPQTVARVRDQVRDLPLAPLIVVAGFMVATLVAAPATLMIGATMLLFGPRFGALYAWFGMLASGSLVFAISRLAARDLIDQWLARRAGSRFDLLSERLQRRGFVAVALMRLTPIPFTLQNAMAGASRIRFRDFIAGTAIGVLPAIALVAGVATEFEAWMANPDWGRLALLGGAVVLALAAGWALKRWATRRSLDR